MLPAFWGFWPFSRWCWDRCHHYATYEVQSLVSVRSSHSSLREEGWSKRCHWVRWLLWTFLELIQVSARWSISRSNSRPSLICPLSGLSRAHLMASPSFSTVEYLVSGGCCFRLRHSMEHSSPGSPSAKTAPRSTAEASTWTRNIWLKLGENFLAFVSPGDRILLVFTG